MIGPNRWKFCEHMAEAVFGRCCCTHTQRKTKWQAKTETKVDETGSILPVWVYNCKILYIIFIFSYHIWCLKSGRLIITAFSIESNISIMNAYTACFKTIILDRIQSPLYTIHAFNLTVLNYRTHCTSLVESFCNASYI